LPLGFFREQRKGRLSLLLVMEFNGDIYSTRLVDLSLFSSFYLFFSFFVTKDWEENW